MNYREIIGPDELDWKVIPLDWKKIGKDELKLGTPMSKDGVEANDASCYGILMDDVQKDKHFQARVIVSGCVDFAKAEEYSGIKISAEAKKAIGKVWSQGGGGLSALPEGYPYKEGVTIEWDGNTEGLESCALGNLTFYKVSDMVCEDLSGASVTAVSGGNNVESVLQVLSSEDSVATYAEASGSPLVLVVSGENELGCTNGVYFLKVITSATLFVSKVYIETIHPMAEEFLPEPQTVTFTMNAEDGGYTASHTGAEIAEMAKRGTVVGKFETDGYQLLFRYIGGMNGAACFISGFANDNGGNIYVYDVAANSTSVTVGAIGN